MVDKWSKIGVQSQRDDREDPDADVELEYLEWLVRDMSIGVNQVVFNLKNLAAQSGDTFTRPT